MKKANVCSVVLLSLFLPISLPAQDAGIAEKEIVDLSLYAEALDLLLEGREDEAVPLLKRFVELHPSSEHRPRAEALIARYENRLERSGIVTFYLGSLGTGVYIAEAVPWLIFEKSDPVTLGLSGLIGVGAGLGSAWLMSNDIDMSIGQDLWIETVEAMAMLNYAFAFNLLTPADLYTSQRFNEMRTWSKIQTGGLMAAAVLGRGGAYLAVRNSRPSPGRALFFASSYLWSQAYYSLLMYGILQSRDRIVNNSLAILVPDLLSVGSYFLYDDLNWSMLRTGLISVGGLGGALVGGFASFAFNMWRPEAVSALIFSATAAGQLVTVLLTREMEDETKRITEQPSFSIVPALTSTGPGVVGSILLK